MNLALRRASPALCVPGLLLATLLPACSAPPKSHWLPDVEPAARPRDPWVLRCVLDKHPRMLVIALSEDLCLAYDTTTCTLSKAWSGDVNFDGPVYTTMHGPQPTTRGDDLHDPLAGSYWDDTASFRGYSLRNGHVTLNWELQAATPNCVGRGTVVPVAPAPVLVYETPEVYHDKEGRLCLVRVFEVTSPEGARVSLIPADALHQVEHDLLVECDGSAEWKRPLLVVDSKGSHDGTGPLSLWPGQSRFVVTYPEHLGPSATNTGSRP